MPELAGKIDALPWVKDGIDGRNEMLAVQGLTRMANAGFAEEAIRLTSKPWFAEGSRAELTFPVVGHTVGDAVWELSDALAWIFSQAEFSDGITSREAKILTVAAHSDLCSPPGARISDLDLADLDVEERTITLPLAGESELTIVRTGPAGDYAMDGLENSVRSIEEFMGHPFPLRQVIYLIDNRGTGGGVANYTHVVIWADELNETIYSDGSVTKTNEERLLEVIAHEAAHYYWRDAPTWLQEGAATFMESVVADSLDDPLEMPGTLCPVPNIAAYQPQFTHGAFFICPYILGERLFHGLYRAMGDDDAFRLAFRRLYLHIHYDLPDSGCSKYRDYDETSCHVREAFTKYAPEGRIEAVEKELAQWFEGVGQPTVRVTVTGPDGKALVAPDGQLSQLSLNFVGPDRWVVVEREVDEQGNVQSETKRNMRESYAVSSLDGTFDMVMPPGTFTVEVQAHTYPSPKVTRWEFIGWYDGDGGLTTDPDKAGQMTIDAEGGQAFEIRLPAEIEDLLCASGQFRGSHDGQCHSRQ